MEKYKCKSCGAESPLFVFRWKEPSITGESVTKQVCEKCMDDLSEKGKRAGIDICDLLYPMP